MEKSSNVRTESDLMKNLKAGNEGAVLKALDELRSAGSAAYLPVLAYLLVNSDFDEVKKNVRSILGELKDPDCAPVMMEIIDDPVNKPVIKELIASCWQNGLDFSPFLPRFVDWVVECDPDIAFEAFTVIENLDHYPAAGIREKEIIKINRALAGADSLKSYLLRELRGMLA